MLNNNYMIFDFKINSKKIYLGNKKVPIYLELITDT